MTQKRKWILGSVLALGVVGAWAAFNVTTLKARYAAYQLRNAPTEDDRAKFADRLIALNDAGLTKLTEFLRSGNDGCRTAAIGAIDRYLNSLPEGDSRVAIVAGRLLDSFGTCDDSGKRAILTLLPTILKQSGQTFAEKGRELVLQGLNISEPGARVAAVRAALHPELRMRAELLPLLNAPEAEVRSAALVAVASGTEGDLILADEDLFRWLHDPDAGVRRICHEALVSRERSEREISLGRRLTNPDSAERLKLLLDLRYDDDVADPEPWLERLSHDLEPAIRAGASRVAAELTTNRRQSCPPWVVRLAEADSDPTVRRIARFYRSLPIRAASGEIRPVGAP